MLHSPSWCSVRRRAGSRFRFPSQVLLEPTRSLYENLLTRGTVLGQPHYGGSDTDEYSTRNPANTARFRRSAVSAQQACQRSAKSCTARYFVNFFQPLRQSSQSFSVALHIASAASCSHRFFLCGRSRLISGICCGEPKCMLAVSHPIEYSSRASSRSAGSETSSIREQSGANRRTTHLF